MTLHPSTFHFNRQMDPVDRTNIVQSRAYSPCGISVLRLGHFTSNYIAIMADVSTDNVGQYGYVLSAVNLASITRAL